MNNLLSYTIPNHILTSWRLADIIDPPSGKRDGPYYTASDIQKSRYNLK